MAVPYFFRALAELFPHVAGGASSAQRPAHTAPAAASKPEAPRHVGRGADNETFVTIDGVPNLFVDEGDCVVQFLPAFEEAPGETRFGTKILPALSPHWAVANQHALPLRDAIAAAIRAKSARQPHYVLADAPVQSHGHGQRETVAHHDRPVPSATERPRRPAGTTRTPGTAGANGKNGAPGRGDLAATIGRIVCWGEEEFPNRKPYGKPFYTSFAMHVDTALGEQILQGEGLKDAIAESRCQVGDHVTVRRLRKVKVAAFHESGQPVLKNGQQVYWDKWLWSITLK
ncbi:hypothetical protein F4827_006321 [Paraburkholderia bannensis]|uniref:Uncharacterized protein n=1 Tax=Paraburkholderia bannensis TaxID=765414 RepID=A0A7W9U538_9BURK|nr:MULTISPECIES: hypothetical protein [Paraburkholderia]MBB3262274.1 hypothetical protein [Paraburkholderia sp. WP4_3_2]MBB6106446.1 hypothetical protein [Paraburkholderia bannensis]